MRIGFFFIFMWRFFICKMFVMISLRFLVEFGESCYFVGWFVSWSYYIFLLFDMFVGFIEVG